jgi:hypothetical protein
MAMKTQNISMYAPQTATGRIKLLSSPTKDQTSPTMIKK